MKLILERWSHFINEQKEDVLFPDWLLGKLDRVHGKPGQGSVFNMPSEQVAEKVKDIIANEPDLDKIANTSGVVSKTIPNIGYDLVAKVVNGKPVDTKGEEITGEITTVEKEEGREKVKVKAVVTDRPLSDFATDQLTVIVRPMKSEDGNPIPGKYIILSAFPGVTATDRRASEWGDDFVVVIPK